MSPTASCGTAAGGTAGTRADAGCRVHGCMYPGAGGVHVHGCMYMGTMWVYIWVAFLVSFCLWSGSPFSWPRACLALSKL